MTRERARVSREKAREALRALPEVLAGRRPDPTGVVEETKKKLADELLRLVQVRYSLLSAGGNDESGQAWKAVRPSTDKRKARKGRAPLILRDTGRLYASLAAEVTLTGAAVTAPVPYARHVHSDRPLWPEPLPPAWRERLLRVVAAGAKELAAALVRRAR